MHPPSLRLLSVLVAVTALGLAPRQSRAATPAIDPATSVKSGELFKAGRAAAAAGDDKTACSLFTESEQLQPAPGTQLNLGACEAKQGHLLLAREHFKRAAAAFRPEDRRRAVALNTADGLTGRLAILTIHVPAVPPDAQVTVGGAALDARVLEHGIEVDPGTTKLVVTAAGRQARAYDVTLAESEKRDVTVEAGEPPPQDARLSNASADPATALPSGDGERTRGETRKLTRTLGFVGIGVGAASVAAGSVFGILALHEASVVKSNCNTTTYACHAAGVSAASSGNTDGIVSTAAFIAGAAFAAAGIYLVVRAPSDRQSLGGSRSPAARATYLEPLVLPGGGGATGTWVF